MSYFFFLSYAHSKKDKKETGFVSQFFEDICNEIAGKSVQTAEPYGFLDQYNLKAGDAWAPELSNAIRTTRTFVCLMSARYFSREYCGREWALFEQRCRSAAGADGTVPPLIIPVVWQFPIEDEFPAFASALQFGISTEGVIDADRGIIDHFNQKGLKYVVQRRMTTHSNAYCECVEQLATQIVERAEKYPLPELPAANLPGIDDITPKFPVDQQAIAAPADVAAAASTRANFAVVAGTRAEIAAGAAHDAGAYSGEATSWIPFHPESNREFFMIAQAQANEARLRCEWIDVDAKLVDRIEEAEENNSIVIMVVDPVTATLPTYAGILRNFDRYTFRNCVVLIPWLGSDTDHDPVHAALENVLRRRFDTAKERYLRTNVSNVEELEAEISAAMKDLGEILSARRKPQRALGAGRFDAPPSLPSV